MFKVVMQQPEKDFLKRINNVFSLKSSLQHNHTATAVELEAKSFQTHNFRPNTDSTYFTIQN